MKNKEFIKTITNEITFVNDQINKLTHNKTTLEIKEMADLHRYSETRLFAVRALALLTNGCE